MLARILTLLGLKKYFIEMKTRHLFTLILPFVFITSGLSWGANGHRIIGEICDRYLSQSAKQEIVAFLGKDYIAEISTWPDYVRSEKGWDFAEKWHYTTVHPYQSVGDVRERYLRDSTINDAIEAIELMKNVLQGQEEATSYFERLMQKNRAKALRGSTKATALAFLVHIVGDIHQPLHVGKNRDLGGNKITVLYFREKSNLHAVWDTDIIEHEKLSYTEFANFIDKLDASEIKEYQDSTVDDWANESIELRERIYNTLYNYTDRESGLPSFSWQYQHDFIPHVERRLVQGGVRLAGMLNDIFNS